MTSTRKHSIGTRVTYIRQGEILSGYVVAVRSPGPELTILKVSVRHADGSVTKRDIRADQVLVTQEPTRAQLDRFGAGPTVAQMDRSF